MSHDLQFYIDGVWVDPVVAHPFDVVDPSDEEVFAQISLGSAGDVDRICSRACQADIEVKLQYQPVNRLALWSWRVSAAA